MYGPFGSHRYRIFNRNRPVCSSEQKDFGDQWMRTVAAAETQNAVLCTPRKICNSGVAPWFQHTRMQKTLSIPTRHHQMKSFTGRVSVPHFGVPGCCSLPLVALNDCVVFVLAVVVVVCHSHCRDYALMMSSSSCPCVASNNTYNHPEQTR